MLSGRGRYELDSWSCTSYGLSEYKADRPCCIELVLEWPNKVLRDGSQGVNLYPGHLHALVHFLRQEWLVSDARSKHP